MDWRTAVINTGITLTRAKQRSSSAERTREYVERLAIRPMRFAPFSRMTRDLDVRADHTAGFPVLTLAPKDTAVRRRILFLHGGSYTYEITPLHWSLIRHLVRSVPAEVVVPIYRLAPHSTAEVTVPAMTAILRELLERDDAVEVTIMGDSAGGGMSLAVAQDLRDQDGRQPAKIVLISPWLDVSLTDPRVADIEPHDRMLGVPGLAEAGRMYAGTLPLDDPRVSPIHGSLAGLAPMHVFTGTDDILNADAHALSDRAAKQGAELHLTEEGGMQHDYPLLPLIRQAGAARQAMTDIVRG